MPPAGGPSLPSASLAFRSCAPSSVITPAAQLTQYRQRRFQLAPRMRISRPTRRFNPSRVHRPRFIQHIHLLQRLPAMIIRRPVSHIGGYDRTKFACRFFELPAILKFIRKHIAKSAVPRGLGQKILESFNTVRHNYHVSVEVK